MEIEFECTYCGKKWKSFPRTQSEVEKTLCDKCGDSTLKVRDASKNKVDYYEGCPPFPEKQEAPEQYNFIMADDYGESRD